MTKLKKDKNKIQNEFLQKILSGFLKLLPSIIILLLLIGGVIYVVSTKAPTEVKEAIPPYAYEGGEEPVVVDNGQLKLTMDPKTTEFSIEVKDSGKVWYSNPQGAAEDALALEDQKAFLQSPFIMSYSIT